MPSTAKIEGVSSSKVPRIVRNYIKLSDAVKVVCEKKEDGTWTIEAIITANDNDAD